MNDLCYIASPMTRIVVDQVAQSDITVTAWLRSLPGYALDRIAREAPDEQIRLLARSEHDGRRLKDACETQRPGQAAAAEE